MADLGLLAAAVATGIGGEVYDRLHPMSWRGARVTGPIHNALFVAAGLLWMLIIPVASAALVRRRRRPNPL